MPINNNLPLDPPLMAKRHIPYSFRAPVILNVTYMLHVLAIKNEIKVEIMVSVANPVLPTLLRCMSYFLTFTHTVVNKKCML
jgi:hypothetical protein